MKSVKTDITIVVSEVGDDYKIQAVWIRGIGYVYDNPAWMRISPESLIMVGGDLKLESNNPPTLRETYQSF